MSLKGVLSISGMGGLFKVVAQTKSGFIVESIVDNKRLPVSATQKISMLEDISVYTTSDDVLLREVFLKMQEHDAEAAAIDLKADGKVFKDFLTKVLPDWDQERVYASDILKMIKWYQLLRGKVTFEEDKEEVKAEDAGTEAVADKDAEAAAAVVNHEEQVVAEKPVKKRAAKKKSE